MSRSVSLSATRQAARAEVQSRAGRAATAGAADNTDVLLPGESSGEDDNNNNGNDDDEDDDIFGMDLETLTSARRHKFRPGPRRGLSHSTSTRSGTGTGSGIGTDAGTSVGASAGSLIHCILPSQRALVAESSLEFSLTSVSTDVGSVASRRSSSSSSSSSNGLHLYGSSLTEADVRKSSEHKHEHGHAHGHGHGHGHEHEHGRALEPGRVQYWVEDVAKSETVHFGRVEALWTELTAAAAQQTNKAEQHAHMGSIRQQGLSSGPHVVPVNHVPLKLPHSILHPLPKAKLGLGKGSKVGASSARLPSDCYLALKPRGRIDLTSYLGVGAFGHVLCGSRDGGGAGNTALLAAKVDSGVAHTLWECVIQLRLLRRLDEPLAERVRARACAGIDTANTTDAAAAAAQAQRVQHDKRTHATHLLFPLYVLRYSNATVLVMPCAELGSLFAALLALHGSSAFSARDREVVVASLTVQMLAAVQLLHDHNIIHTDIKNDNWCLRSVTHHPSASPHSAHPLTPLPLVRLYLRVGPSEAPIQLCLIDFGKAKDLRETQAHVQVQAQVQARSGKRTHEDRPPQPHQVHQPYQQARSFCGSSAITAMTSPEMLRGEPWIYHADYFAVSESLTAVHPLCPPLLPPPLPPPLTPIANTYPNIASNTSSNAPSTPLCPHAQICACMHSLLFANELATAVEGPEVRARRGIQGGCGGPARIPKTTLPRYWHRPLWSALYLALLHTSPGRPTVRADLAALQAACEAFLRDRRQVLAGVLQKLTTALLCASAKV